MNQNNYVVILAGGVGSRFWPKSRHDFPKQFIDVLGIGKSLLQLTYERFINVCPKENIFILSNKQYQSLIRKQIPDLKEEQILLEPTRNNTAPCIAYASYKLLERNPNANIVVAPSDHLILNNQEFLIKIKQSLAFTASNDALLTLGIFPNRPDTGYGYIKFKKEEVKEIHPVISFMEKPLLEKARAFLLSGDYLWNAGIFIWSAKSICKAFEKYAPEIHLIFRNGKSVYNTSDEILFLNENYPASPCISIDYAILEKADNVFTLPAEIGWSDLGTWASLHSVAEKDENKNALNGGKIKLELTRNCIIDLPKGKSAVIKGLNDFIVVDDGKVLLIYPKSDEQEIKNTAKWMVENYGKEYL